MSKIQTMASTVTALLSVYRGSSPKNLDLALTSLWQQTRSLDAVLLVTDGPVDPDLDAVIAEHADTHEELRVLRLPTNQGLGPALQAGLGHITTDYVARLDDDDLAAPERIARQTQFLDSHPSISVVGTAVQEFDDAAWDETGSVEQSLTNIRALPVAPDQIAKYARLNSPLNHPSIMARTNALTEVGGYMAVHHMEDYDLWARMIAAGHKLVNLPEPLTYFRTSDAQFARRTGREMFAAEAHMQRNLHSYGLISRPRAVLNFIVRSAYRLLPTGLLRRVYSRLFHR